MQDSDLEGLFAAARAAAPQPSTALLARIEADGLREQARHAQPARAAPKANLLARLLAALGGVPVAAGLVTATLVGVWIGLVQPAPLTVLTDRLGGGLSGAVTLDSVELIPALDPFAAEG